MADKRKVVLGVALLIMAGAAALFSNISALELVELGYDDGTADEFVSLSNWGEGVLFSPPSTPWSVYQVKIYGKGVGDFSGTEFAVEFWDSIDSRTLAKYTFPSSKFSTVDKFVTLDLSPPLVVNKSFYAVVFTYSTKEKGIAVGLDSGYGNTPSLNKHSLIFSRTPPIIDWSPQTQLGLVNTPYSYVNWMIRVLGIDLKPPPTTSPPPKPKLVIAANTIDYPLAKELVDALKTTNTEIIFANPETFESYKNEKFIVILGGPDAPQGMGNISKKYLASEEQDFLRTKGSRKMYIKTAASFPAANTTTNATNTTLPAPPPLQQGQKVILLAGSDRYETKKAHEENRAKVLAEIF